MSLQVWLPLDGDTTNYGATSINFESGTPVYAKGKITPLALTNSGQIIFRPTTTLIQTITTSNVYSMCAWVKNNNSSGGNDRYVFWIGQMAKGNTRGFYEIASKKTNRHWAYNGSGVYVPAGTTIDINNWYHICFTVSGATLKLYINGNYGGQITNAATTAISADKAIGLNATEYSINDFRLYDHTLTDKEVKDIASQTKIENVISDGFNKKYSLIEDSAGNKVRTNGAVNIIDPKGKAKNIKYAALKDDFTAIGSPLTASSIKQIVDGANTSTTKKNIWLSWKTLGKINNTIISKSSDFHNYLFDGTTGVVVNNDYAIHLPCCKGATVTIYRPSGVTARVSRVFSGSINSSKATPLTGYTTNVGSKTTINVTDECDFVQVPLSSITEAAIVMVQLNYEIVAKANAKNYDVKTLLPGGTNLLPASGTITWSSAAKDGASTRPALYKNGLDVNKTYIYRVENPGYVKATHNGTVGDDPKNKHFTIWLYEKGNSTYTGSNSDYQVAENFSAQTNEKPYITNYLRAGNTHFWLFKPRYANVMVRLNNYSDGTNALSLTYSNIHLSEAGNQIITIKPYITFNGSQHIDTGLKLSNNSYVDIDFSMSSIASQMAIFGVRADSSTIEWHWMDFNPGNGLRFGQGHGSTKYVATSVSSPAANSRYPEAIHKNNFYHLGSFATSVTATTFTNTRNCYIGWANGGTMRTAVGLKGNVYMFAIDDNVFVPANNGTTDGMFNTKTGEFKPLIAN